VSVGLYLSNKSGTGGSTTERYGRSARDKNSVKLVRHIAPRVANGLSAWVMDISEDQKLQNRSDR
jgi:hypothetical protein